MKPTTPHDPLDDQIVAALHGDRGVWRLLDRRAAEVVDVPLAGPIPPDIDTWEDYQRALATAPAGRVAERRGSRRRAGESTAAVSAEPRRSEDAPGRI